MCAGISDRFNDRSELRIVSERSCSGRQRMKTYLRSTMGRDSRNSRQKSAKFTVAFCKTRRNSRQIQGMKSRFLRRSDQMITNYKRTEAIKSLCTNASVKVLLQIRFVFTKI